MPSVARWTRSILLLLLTAAPAYAQFETASIVGTVRDTTGAVMPGTTVTLTNTATGVSVTKTTSTDGSYEFFTVKDGLYVITAEKSGFSVAVADNIEVQVGGRLRVDLQLPIGQVSEKIMVTGASPLIETESSQRGQVIAGAQVTALPLNGREYSALALLTTGVRQSDLNRGGTGTNREGAFNVNGLRSMFNNFLIDGVDNNAYGTSNQGFSNQVMQPPPDAVSEFKVVTNNLSAEYGRGAGATINVAYKSGGNALHGNAWEFNRNTALNATGFFVPPSGQKPELNRNQYGGVVGGPIVKNRAFFFGDFEGFRQDRSQAAFSTIATIPQRAGIFPVAVRDPRTGVIYPAGTAIPLSPLRHTGHELAAGPHQRQRHQQLRHPAAVHEPHRQGGRQDRSPAQPDDVGVGAVRLARSRDRRPAVNSAARRRQRQRPDLRAQHTARPRRDVRAEQHVAARNALRVVVDRRRQEPAGARIAERVRRVRHQRPADRPPHRRAACPRSSSRASRISAARPPTRSGSTPPCGTRSSTTRGSRDGTRSRPVTNTRASPQKSRT